MIYRHITKSISELHSLSRKSNVKFVKVNGESHSLKTDNRVETLMDETETPTYRACHSNLNVAWLFLVSSCDTPTSLKPPFCSRDLGACP